ncbi:type IV secretory system conjugative DNA transfer family protein [Halococcus sediminicola]|uniref:type IV secretory system conjugative DNA transfer family protein n=1 Tax=Halococcus sediminicola TaxID=1264579 RepID=UPI0006784F13|nr:TraM recognition domain-containing protein [Halococcus sediminicola]
MSETADTETEAEAETEDWPYAVTPASEDEQRQFTRREMKMIAENGNIYAGSRARAMVEYAEQVPDQPRWIGATERDNKDVSLPYSLLFRHIFIGGLTGMGKSTLEKNIVQQHIYAGKGVCYIDPKGDDVLDILMSIPKERWDDVIFISPGSDAFRKQVGFNLLETHSDPGDPGFDGEVEGIVNDLKALLAADDYWGPRMDGIASNMLRGMIRHEFDFTLADMFGALLDEESRAEYANLIQASDEDLSFIQGYTKKIAELDDIDLDAIRRRLKDWVEEPTMRQIVAQRDAKTSIPQAVEDEKIILVNNNLPDEPKEAVATAILRQIWTAVDSRPSARDQLMQDMAEADDGGVGEFDEEAVDEAVREHEESGGSFDADYTPYFLVIDEAHDVLSEGSKVEKMLAKARSKRLGLTIATQQLRQLDQDAQDAILGNCNSLISYDPGHPDEAKLLSRRFGEKDDQDLLETDQFHAWMRTATGPGKRSRPFLAEAFPPYPPLHSIKDAYRLIVKSLDEYGTVPPTSEEVQDKMHFSTAGSVEEQVEESQEIDDQQAAQVAKAAYDEWLRRENKESQNNERNQQNQNNEDNEDSQQNGEGERWVLVEKPAIRKRVDRYLPTVDVSHVSLLWHVIDHVPDDLLEVAERDGKMFMRCTERGKNRIFETGSAGSAGGGKHRTLLKDGYAPLFRAGMVVSLPTQGDGDMPDGVADLSDVAMLDFEIGERTHRDVRNVSQQFEQQYPLLDRFAIPQGANPVIIRRTDGPAVAIEAESSTGDSKPAQSLFNLAQAYNKGQHCLFTCRERVAGTLWQTLTENSYYSHSWDGEHQRCYNSGELMVNGQMMLRPKGARQTVWLHDEESGEYLLRDSDGEEHARFESATEVFEQPEKYPATSEVVPDDQRDKYVPVYRPFIPEYHFDRRVSESAWDIVVVPEDADQPEDLHLYRGPDVEQLPITEAVGEEQSASVSVDENEDDSRAEPADAGAAREETATSGSELSDEQREQMEKAFPGDEDSDSSPVLEKL